MPANDLARQMLQAIEPLALGRPQNVVVLAAAEAMAALLQACVGPGKQRKAFADMAQLFVAYAQAERPAAGAILPRAKDHQG